MNNITRDTVRILINNDKKLDELVKQAEKNRPYYNFSPDVYLEALYLYCREKDNSSLQIKSFERIMGNSKVATSFMQQVSLNDKRFEIYDSLHLSALALLLDSLECGLKPENIVVHTIEEPVNKDVEGELEKGYCEKANDIGIYLIQDLQNDNRICNIDELLKRYENLRLIVRSCIETIKSDPKLYALAKNNDSDIELLLVDMLKGYRDLLTHEGDWCYVTKTLDGNKVCYSLDNLCKTFEIYREIIIKNLNSVLDLDLGNQS